MESKAMRWIGVAFLLLITIECKPNVGFAAAGMYSVLFAPLWQPGTAQGEERHAFPGTTETSTRKNIYIGKNGPAWGHMTYAVIFGHVSQVVGWLFVRDREAFYEWAGMGPRMYYGVMLLCASVPLILRHLTDIPWGNDDSPLKTASWAKLNRSHLCATGLVAACGVGLIYNG